MRHNLKSTIHASILRVNRQVDDEALQAMQREFTFVLVTFVGHAGTSIVKALEAILWIPATTQARTNVGYSAFPHYVAELQLSIGHSIPSPEHEVTQFMVIDDWTWRRILYQIARTATKDDGISARKLEVRLNFRGSQHATTEASLFAGIRQYLWNFDNFEIHNATNNTAAQEVVELVSRDRWPTIQHYFADLTTWRKESVKAFLNGSDSPACALQRLQETAMLPNICTETGHYGIWLRRGDLIELSKRRIEHMFECAATALEAALMLALLWSPGCGCEDNVYAIMVVNHAILALEVATESRADLFKADDSAVAKVLYGQGVAFRLMNRLSHAEDSLSKVVKLPSDVKDLAMAELEKISALRESGLDQGLREHGVQLI
jgi:hypothetical protein